MIYTSLLVISEIKMSCNYLNWGKKIQTETIQFSDIIFTQSDIYAEHNNGCHSQTHFTSALCVHKNTLLLCYVFAKIFYFYTMCSQQYFTSTLCVHNNILPPHWVHNTILLPHYVFTKIFYFYTMCSQKYFTSTLCSKQYFTSTLCVHKNILLPQYVFTTIFYFHSMCSQQYFTSTLCGLIKYKYDIQYKMNCELHVMLTYDTPRSSANRK